MSQPFALAVLIFTLAISVGISIALINVDCYSTYCSEGPFTFETRVHITVYYAFLATLVFLLLLRTNAQQITNIHIAHELPLVGKRVTLGGLLTSIAILTVTLCSTIYWLPAHDELWGYKTDPLDWASAKLQLTITGVTGHYADILLGLLLIPVSRNSLVGQAFYLHQSTLLFAHKAVSYMFALSVIVHGVAYMLHANDSSRNDNEARHEAFAIGNPALTVAESKQLGGWFSLTFYVGIAAILPVLVILVTSMPWIRRRHYNLFYFSHVMLGTVTIVASCLHASTNFYLLLPGLLLWIVDWIRRLFFGEARGLASKTPAVLEIAENGWLRVSLLPDRAIFGPPLLYYYLNFPSVSKVQTHAFTAVAHPANNGGPVFLIQPEAKEKEWTWKLRALVQRPRATLRLDARVEGPYPVSDANFTTASHIVCIVGGSGITGALSLAHWWLETRPTNTRFDLIWTARHRETTRLAEWQNLEEVAKTACGFIVTTHVSSESGRLDAGQALRQALSGRRTSGSGWVYSSGPPALLSGTEQACVEFQKNHCGKDNEKGWTVQDLSWYMARWEV